MRGQRKRGKRRGEQSKNSTRENRVREQSNRITKKASNRVTNRANWHELRTQTINKTDNRQRLNSRTVCQKRENKRCDRNSSRGPFQSTTAYARGKCWKSCRHKLGVCLRRRRVCGGMVWPANDCVRLTVYAGWFEELL